MSSLTVLSWWLWLFELMSCASTLGHKTTSYPNELPCGVGLNNYNKIVDGSDASTGQYPFMVNLRHWNYPGQHLCGGVIIGARHILTARHCVDDDHVNKEMEVFIGDYNQSKTGDGERKILIEAPILHTKALGTDWFNDIALIRTVEPIQFFLNYSSGHGSVNQICMPNHHHLLSSNLVGFNTTVAGWGFLHANGSGPAEVLQELPMKVYECPELHKKQVCAVSASPPKGTQGGDSGSPLFWRSPQGKAYLIGILSGGDEQEAFFVDVRLHLDWIAEMMTSQPLQPSSPSSSS